jgi:hypothetical protein
MQVRRITEALKVRLRRSRSDAVAGWSLLVAVLASAASIVQAAVLAGQVWTPYRTSLYVRQLEVSGNYYAAAHEQWAAILDLSVQCALPENIDGDAAAFATLSQRFRTGSSALHSAYAGAVASFPELLHAKATRIWLDNEFMIEQVVMPSENCRAFVDAYDSKGVFARAERMHERALSLVDDMRLLLRVDRWSRTDLERERARREVLQRGRKVASASLFTAPIK